MNRLDDIERVVSNFLDMHPADIDMLYSLAGCYYKQGRYDESMEQLNKILLFRPQHELANELRDIIINLENEPTAAGVSTQADMEPTRVG